jgi:hypothetical protein
MNSIYGRLNPAHYKRQPFAAAGCWNFITQKARILGGEAVTAFCLLWVFLL